MARQRLRLVQVRKPGSFDDEKTPADILANGEAGADEQEQIEYILSQIRQILGTADWKDNVPISLSDLFTFSNAEVCNEVPTGAKDNSNQVYTTLFDFELGSEKLYVNGQRLSRVDGFCDYVASESGGVGTGYDTVTLDLIKPRSDDSIMLDYTKA